MANFASVSNLNVDLVRKALTGALIVAPYTATALTRSNLFTAGGELATPFVTGYKSGGITTDEGLRFARSTESDTVTGWQYREPVRDDLTSDSETIAVDFLETNKTTIELYTGADLSAVSLTNGAISIQKPALPSASYFRCLALAVDNIQGDELYIARYYPRCRVTAWQEQAFGKAGALQWGMTFTTYVDPVLQYSKDDMIGGPAFETVAEAMGFDLTFS
jgi:hypothetical protein